MGEFDLDEIEAALRMLRDQAKTTRDAFLVTKYATSPIGFGQWQSLTPAQLLCKTSYVQWLMSQIPVSTRFMDLQIWLQKYRDLSDAYINIYHNYVMHKYFTERAAAEKAAAEKMAAAERAAERAAAERIVAEKVATNNAAAERVAPEKATSETTAAEKRAAPFSGMYTAAEERATAERVVAERVATERVAAEREAADREVERTSKAVKLPHRHGTKWLDDEDHEVWNALGHLPRDSEGYLSTANGVENLVCQLANKYQRTEGAVKCRIYHHDVRQMMDFAHVKRKTTARAAAERVAAQRKEAAAAAAARAAAERTAAEKVATEKVAAERAFAQRAAAFARVLEAEEEIVPLRQRAEAERPAAAAAAAAAAAVAASLWRQGRPQSPAERPAAKRAEAERAAAFARVLAERAESERAAADNTPRLSAATTALLRVTRAPLNAHRIVLDLTPQGHAIADQT